MDYYFPGESSSFILRGEEIDSTILSKHRSSQIESWLLEDGLYEDLELLYRGSRDGRKGSYFNDKCDNKGATITAIQSTGGFIFGGFSDKIWTSSKGYCEYDKAFLFSLKSPANEVGPTKMRIMQNGCFYDMYYRSTYGPYFGDGHDLRIGIDANNNINSYSRLGHTYEIPPGQTNTFLVGSKNFKVSEIEVFQII